MTTWRPLFRSPAYAHFSWSLKLFLPISFSPSISSNKLDHCCSLSCSRRNHHTRPGWWSTLHCFSGAVVVLASNSKGSEFESCWLDNSICLKLKSVHKWLIDHACCKLLVGFVEKNRYENKAIVMMRRKSTPSEHIYCIENHCQTNISKGKRGTWTCIHVTIT